MKYIYFNIALPPDSFACDVLFFQNTCLHIKELNLETRAMCTTKIISAFDRSRAVRTKNAV